MVTWPDGYERMLKRAHSRQDVHAEASLPSTRVIPLHMFLMEAQAATDSTECHRRLFNFETIPQAGDAQMAEAKAFFMNAESVYQRTSTELTPEDDDMRELNQQAFALKVRVARFCPREPAVGG
ncbi:hypothetical protein RI054_08g45030 [Pseudoscourfieldia marina]